MRFRAGKQVKLRWNVGPNPGRQIGDTLWLQMHKQISYPIGNQIPRTVPIIAGNIRTSL